MATIKDVANLAGVSIATASRVINDGPNIRDSTKAAVKDAMERLGYRPNINARALVNKSSNTIGVLVNDLSFPFFGQMTKAIDNIASQQNKQLLIGSGYHDKERERSAIKLLIDSRCQSLVLHSKGMSDAELIALSKETPGMVLINRYVPEIAARCIALDNRKGAYLATQHLIDNGHRHIGYICSNHDIDDARERQEGYLAALRDNGIAINENYIEYAEPDEKGGESAIINLIAQNLPITAIACYNDDMAAGCVALLMENGIQIPQDMSVIGFDDSHIARYVYPRLTTIRYPIQVMAKQAVQLSLKLADADQPPEEAQKLFIPVLVKRGSVSGPKTGWEK